MLTRDLIRAREVGDRIEPSFLNVERKDLVEAARDLGEIVAMAVRERWTRAALEEAVDLRASAHRSRKALAGLARLILADAEFEPQSGLDPALVRSKVFAYAQQIGPLAVDPAPSPHNPFERPTALDVYAHVAAELGCAPDDLERALYADLRDHHQLIAAPVPEATALLHRYNVALVQGILLRATEVRVTLAAPTVPRVRQLLRYAKFHQLMVRATRDDGDLHLVLDGPASVLSQSTRYGMQLAQFFPSILLQTGAWRFEARLLWGPGGDVRTLELNHQAKLKSHLPDTGAWQTPEQKMFAERWEALGDTGWTMTDQTTPMVLDHKAVLLPDFTFTKDGRTAHLDIVGFWRKEWLARRLEALRHDTPGNYVLAISKRLGADEDATLDLPGEIIPFGQIVPAKAVLDAISRVAS